MRRIKKQIKFLSPASGIFMVLCFVFLGNRLTAQDNMQTGTRTIVQDANGAVYLHASTGFASGTEIAYMPEWQAFGWFRSDGKVEWNVEVNRPGKYAVYLEWSVSDDEAGKGFVLQYGEKRLKGKVGKSGSWETFRKKRIGYVKLEVGRQKIVFKPELDFGNGALLDFREISMLPTN